MKIRLTGTRDEITTALPVLAETLDIQEVSDFYPNRGTGRLGRVYLEIAGIHPHRVRATAARADRTPPAITHGRDGERR